MRRYLRLPLNYSENCCWSARDRIKKTTVDHRQFQIKSSSISRFTQRIQQQCRRPTQLFLIPEPPRLLQTPMSDFVLHVSPTLLDMIVQDPPISTTVVAASTIERLIGQGRAQEKADAYRRTRGAMARGAILFRVIVASGTLIQTSDAVRAPRTKLHRAEERMTESDKIIGRGRDQTLSHLLHPRSVAAPIPPETTASS